MRFIIIILVTALSAPVLAQGKKPKFTKEYIERIDLAGEIPHPIDAFSYRVRGKYNDLVYYDSEVPLWDMGESFYESDKIAVGTAVELKYVVSKFSRNFFGFKRDVEVAGKKIPKILWLDGRFIEIAGSK